MVTLKNSDVLGALMTLRKLDNVKFSAPTSLKLVKLNKVLEAHWGDVDKVRKQLVEENVLVVDGVPATPDKDGTVPIDPAKKEEVDLGIKALFESTFEVDDKLVLKVSDFGGVDIEPAVFFGLGDLITE